MRVSISSGPVAAITSYLRSPLLPICLAAFLVRFAPAIAFPSVHQSDEIFQSLEQGHRLAFGIGIVPWEFQQGIRSWALPGFIAAVMWLGGDEYYLHAARAAQVLISLIPVIVAYGLGFRFGSLPGAIAGGTLGAVWVDFVYFAPKAFTEVVAGHLLAGGLYLGYVPAPVSRARMFFAGALLGLAAVHRVHMLPVVILATVWICWPGRRGRTAIFLSGLALPCLLNGLADWIFWGYPFQSWWKQVQMQLALSHEIGGRQPWTFYAAKFYRFWSWGMLPVGLLALRGMTRLPLFGCCAALALVTHSAVSHKEYRYIYSAIVLIVLLAAAGAADLLRANARDTRHSWRFAAATVLGFTCISGSLAIAPDYLRFWKERRGLVTATVELGRSDDACGIGLWRLPWFATAGYAHLHRDIPIYQLPPAVRWSELKPQVNYVLALVEHEPPITTEFALVGCRESDIGTAIACIYRRVGSCLPDARLRILHPPLFSSTVNPASASPHH